MQFRQRKLLVLHDVAGTALRLFTAYKRASHRIAPLHIRHPIPETPSLQDRLQTCPTTRVAELVRYADRFQLNPADFPHILRRFGKIIDSARQLLLNRWSRFDKLTKSPIDGFPLAIF